MNKLIWELRKRTNAPLMVYKMALLECNQNLNEAIEWIRKRTPPIGLMVKGGSNEFDAR